MTREDLRLMGIEIPDWQWAMFEHLALDTPKMLLLPRHAGKTFIRDLVNNLSTPVDNREVPTRRRFRRRR